MKKILFVTASMSRGGAERVISILSDYFASKGFIVDVVVLFSGELGYVLNPAVRFIDASSGGPKVFRLFSSIRLCRRVLKDERPDLVFSFLDSVSLVVWPASRGLRFKAPAEDRKAEPFSDGCTHREKHGSTGSETGGKKAVRRPRLVCSERIDPTSSKRPWIFRRLINLFYSRSDALVVQTERAFGFFPDRVKRKSFIIPNPVSVSCEAAPFPLRKPVFVTAGRLTAQKNHKLLLNAFARIHDRVPGWTLEIYGDGEMRDCLMEEISSLGLQGFVHLKGNRSNIHENISDAGCFVLSSDYEGFSNALLEAMMMGLPCISTDVAGSGEAIRAGKSGIIVPVNDVGALSSAMLFIAEHPVEAMEMGLRARCDAGKYRRDAVCGLWEDLARHLLFGDEA